MRRALLLLIALATLAAAAARRTSRSPTSWSAATRRSSGATPAATPERGRGLRIDPRGSPSSPTARRPTRSGRSCKKGVDDAARKTGVATSYARPTRTTSSA